MTEGAGLRASRVEDIYCALSNAKGGESPLAQSSLFWSY
jgi:hypothetical protein